jgi:hypothetical protein
MGQMVVLENSFEVLKMLSMGMLGNLELEIILYAPSAYAFGEFSTI